MLSSTLILSSLNFNPKAKSNHPSNICPSLKAPFNISFKWTSYNQNHAQPPSLTMKTIWILSGKKNLLHDDNIEEIETEPELRPSKNSILLANSDASVSSISSCDTLVSPTTTSKGLRLSSPSLGVIKERQDATVDSFFVGDSSLDSLAGETESEFQERRRTTYSFCSNSLPEAVTSHTLKRRIISNLPTDPIRVTSPPKPSEESSSPGFSCNICFDTASNPVLTLCGHLFCWPCLHRWLVSQYRNPLCPVCKAGCGKDKVIPVYGRGSEEKDPRNSESIPDRPKGQRPKPQPAQSYGGWGRVFGMGADFGTGTSPFNVHAGLGFFPTLTFQYTPEHGAQFHTNGIPFLILF
ncbi:hypothetical protein DSO57_1016494 [Entomophthora muscae]|uniref:Uncharacterized protein n=1 Tax=Entomophthora muscae TaxID=34485 RepID=A0ACC2TFS2_9FUNG|nr:hypothetical protein DSO57_1016494 [Entomophthora muscae]